MPRNLLLSLTVCVDKDITHYEHGRGRRCISIDGDHGRSVVGASGLELGPLGWGRSRSGKDLRVVEVSEWWKAALDQGRFRDGGDLRDGQEWQMFRIGL